MDVGGRTAPGASSRAIAEDEYRTCSGETKSRRFRLCQEQIFQTESRMFKCRDHMGLSTFMPCVYPCGVCERATVKVEIIRLNSKVTEWNNIKKNL